MVALKGSGVDRITQERRRQILQGRDDANNTEFELSQCAAEVICNALEDQGSHVDGWAPARAAHIRKKYKGDLVARLTIAGALIAAEIDRLLALQSKAKQRRPTMFEQLKYPVTWFLSLFSRLWPRKKPAPSRQGHFFAPTAMVAWSADGTPTTWDIGLLGQEFSFHAPSVDSYGCAQLATDDTVEVIGLFTRLLGPSALMEEFYEQFGDVAKIATNKLLLKMPMTHDTPYALPMSAILHFEHVVLTQIGMSVVAEQMTINEHVRFQARMKQFCSAWSGAAPEEPDHDRRNL